MVKTCSVPFQNEAFIFLFFPFYFDGWEEKRKKNNTLDDKTSSILGHQKVVLCFCLFFFVFSVSVFSIEIIVSLKAICCDDKHKLFLSLSWCIFFFIFYFGRLNLICTLLHSQNVIFCCLNSLFWSIL